METDRPLFASGLEWESLKLAHEEIHRYPPRQNAIAKLNQGFKSGITDDQLAKLVIFLREQDAFCIINAEDDQAETQIICSMGLFQGENNGGLR
jgi:hypothetical protein